MAFGKDEFRTKYKESNDCIEKIKDNYYDLDYEYQMIAKQLQQKENIIKEVIKHIENNKYWNGDNWNCLHCEKILEILDKVGDEK